MPQLRKDPILSRWVIVSTERGKRPTDFGQSEEVATIGGFCPFCYGNEDKTPPEIIAFREEGTKPNRPGWLVRVVPNKYPALQIEGDLNRQGSGMYDMMNGVGAHEVIIETPHHEKGLDQLDDAQVERIIWAFRDRSNDLRKDTRFKYILIFKNFGKRAGCSLEHPHSQLIATPIIPKRVEEEIAGARSYYQYKERCIFCDIVRQEMTIQDRLVSENKGFISFEPFAARFPYETWIVPKFHSADFATMDNSQVTSLARILRETVWRLVVALGRPAYNFIIHTSPSQNGQMPEYHWHIEIMPRLTRVAGFEWGSGFFINPTTPEDAAAVLREVSSVASVAV